MNGIIMPKPCRYLEGCIHANMTTSVNCIYWDMPLQDKETIRCYPGGWECYEEPAKGIIYENGRWMTCEEYSEFLENKPGIPDYIEYEIIIWDGKIRGQEMRELTGWDRPREEPPSV